MPVTSNFSKDDIARFAAIADEWWNDTGKFKTLHKLNPSRLRFVRDCLTSHFVLDPTKEPPLAGITLLDVGCGGGLMSEPLSRLGADITAIDAGKETIEAARNHASRCGLKIEYRQAMPEEIHADGLLFNVVMSLEVIEHVPNPNEFLSTLAALVAPGGVLVIATLNRTLKSLLLAKIGAEYVLRWIPAGTHNWKKFIRPRELIDGLQPHKFYLQEIKGLVFNPLRDEWFLSSDADVNYIACFASDKIKSADFD